MGRAKTTSLGRPRRRKGLDIHKPNHLLANDVAAELDWDPLLNDSRIAVAADDGTVTLTGAVDSYYESLVATDDAWSVAGVTNVDNELLVGLVGDAVVDIDLGQPAASRP
jgi:hypothetical protein